MSLVQYLVFCETESLLLQTDYMLSTATPTCPHNITHILDPTKTQPINTTTLQTVAITQGGTYNYFFKSRGYGPITIPAGPSTTHIPLTQPYPIVPLMLTLFPDTANVGDSFCVNIYPELTAPPTLSVALNIGDTTLTLSSAILLTSGLAIGYPDPSNVGSYLPIGGEVIDVNYTTNIVTLESASTIAFPIGQALTPYMIRVFNVPIANGENITIGGNNFTSQENSSSTTSELIYTNNSTSAKTLSFEVQFRHGLAPAYRH